MSNFGSVLVFMCLAGITALGTFYFVEKDCQKTLRMIAQGELARGIMRAEGAYSTQSLFVAKWELERLKELLQSSFFAEFEAEKTIRFNAFIATARLAKICQELGEQTQAQIYVSHALEGATQFYPAVTNSEALFRVLAEIDTRLAKNKGTKSAHLPEQLNSTAEP